MSRGLGSVQRAVLAAVHASPVGLDTEAIASRLHGDDPTASQRESVRRAIRTLRDRELIEVTTHWVTRPRRSLKRIFDLSGCDVGFCAACAQRMRRTRLQNRHRRAMRDNARIDPAWLQDLAAAEASGFVHYAASAERLITIDPDVVDTHQRRLQVVTPVHPPSPHQRES